MEVITSGVIALCMFYQGGVIEHTYIKDQKMSTCLKMKRTVERSVNPQNVRMACGEVDAILEEYMGSTKIVKIVKDKYDTQGYTK
jgi:Holliday junction resolvase-like predicted endonuclease